MEALYSAEINTELGTKEIAVYSCDIIDFDEEIDILTTSAFIGSYVPTPRTVFRALWDEGISVEELSKAPLIDLRKFCHTWLSDEINKHNTNIRRIGCVELLGYHLFHHNMADIEHELIKSICAYFSMLDIATVYDIKMDTVALPLLGSGSQRIDSDLMLVPLINECISFLKRNRAVKKICFIEKNNIKAQNISDYMKSSYNLLNQNTATCKNGQSAKDTMAFISYASEDKNIADNLCSKLENNGVRMWYAPRDVKGPYADAITKAIEGCTHFIVILSENSMRSQHVLNEIDLAFQGLPDNIKFKPLRIDETVFTPSFKYYLSRQHWMDAVIPPLELRLNEFVESLLADS